MVKVIFIVFAFTITTIKEILYSPFYMQSEQDILGMICQLVLENPTQFLNVLIAGQVAVNYSLY